MGEYITLILLGLSLAMDAFSVSICDGLTISNLNKKKSILIATTFAIFQGLMPLIGYLLGSLFIEKIEKFDHYIAFTLLLFIGGKMIFDALKERKELKQRQKALESGESQGEIETPLKEFKYGEILLQGLATSIDALACGLTLLAMQINIFIDISIISVITFVICLLGVFLGKVFDKLFKGKTYIAEIIGGAVLILLGTKILIEHLCF